ncbi:MAG: DUF4382 domain-containing protein [Croceitalea sp.]|nr:DUF4382 domain-containing protein [Croceitalea sp.]MBT8238825.1 DUF4382 domain-containing protein [Croceitalea sp.]NNC34243.1 DUF4382 domain-containing protein [Croceitalea sp.]NNL09494.1 DUF4382 domain-containing protein [Croceitalea sp.]NNM19378.1 DUF4382 domain-containing protein [Croceitalea sp.]
MKHLFKTTVFALVISLMATSCSKDDNEDVNFDEESYNTTFKLTDAPIDDSKVEAVFVTITDVKVDGNSLNGFTATTVELSALVNGQTQTLGNLDLQAGSYSNIELVLDYDTDVNGNAPGCYVEMANGEKDKLEASANSINVNKTFEVLASTSNDIVIDFDLRKTIKEEENNLSSDFEFVTMSELQAGIRVVNDEMAGSISGTANDAENTSDKIIVYAYEQGTFNEETETQGSGASNVTFANAVTSAEVDGLGNTYNLSFIAEGMYELVFVSYTEDSNNELQFNALLEAESTTGLNLGAISVSSALQVNANVTITGTMQ